MPGIPGSLALQRMALKMVNGLNSTVFPMGLLPDYGGDYKLRSDELGSLNMFPLTVGMLTLPAGFYSIEGIFVTAWTALCALVCLPKNIHIGR